MTATAYPRLAVWQERYERGDRTTRDDLWKSAMWEASAEYLVAEKASPWRIAADLKMATAILGTEALAGVCAAIGLECVPAGAETSIDVSARSPLAGSWGAFR